MNTCAVKSCVLIASFFCTFAASSNAQVVISSPQIDPAIAQSNRITYVAPISPAGCIVGRVILQIEIESDGSVGKIIVKSGLPMLRGAALDAVKQWKYRPLKRGGVVAPVSTTISVPFVKSTNPPCR